MKLQNDNTIQSVSKIKRCYALVLLFFMTASAFSQSDIIPSEVRTTFEAIRDWIQNEFAPILLGIFWIMSAIVFGYNKDSSRAKTAFIAVTIACIAIGLAIKIVEKFLKMGK